MQFRLSRLPTVVIFVTIAFALVSTSVFAQGRPSYIWESEYWQSPKIYISLAIAAVLGVVWAIAAALRAKAEERRRQREEKRDEA